MASFMTSLWESIFTPGPTPTLLIATNASFGALQLLLLVLLFSYASQSHFVVLSIPVWRPVVLNQLVRCRSAGCQGERRR